MSFQTTLQKGIAIPAHPLALDANRKLDARRQRALSRYYIASGAGGLAVGVHTTQFEIRSPGIDLYQPVLELAAEEFETADQSRETPLVRIAGICGETSQAVQEATLAKDLGYHAGLLSLAAVSPLSLDEQIAHCRAVAEVIPLFGFYLQPDVGGCVLPFQFWCRFCEIENVVGIKIAPFNRYRTLDVIRATIATARDDIALYTGNDDNIILDLITEFQFPHNGATISRRIVGGLLGHWSVWTKRAIEQLEQCQAISHSKEAAISKEFLQLNTEVTDCNAVFFDAANNFQGCIPGLHEVLRRQGLLEGTWCLNPNECLSKQQSEEIDRLYAWYPHLNDDRFIAEHLDDWLDG